MAGSHISRSAVFLHFLIGLLGSAAGHSSHTSGANEVDGIPRTPAPERLFSIRSVNIRKNTRSTSRGEALSDYLYPDRCGSHSPSVVDLIGASYIAEVTIGTQTVPLLVDTGSSDLWVVPNSFNCLDADGNAVVQSKCRIPSFVADTFSGGAVPGEYLSIRYANGQYAYGPYGLESVSLGGITVPAQQIALLSEGYIEVSSGEFAGILGLGYPHMVAGRKGGKPRHYVDNTDPMITYDTWFANAVKQNLTEPVFSMALNMDGGGLLAIGGVVDVPIEGTFAAAPIHKFNLINDTRADTEFTYYTIIAEDFIINGQPWSKRSARADSPSGRMFPLIVDSGFTTTPLPPSLVTLFYNTFIDPPELVEIEGTRMYAVQCDEFVVPVLGVQIGGQVFEMTTVVSRLNATENGKLFCGLGVQPGIEEAGALGDSFLSNVVAVFDVGASEMRFAQRSVKRRAFSESAEERANRYFSDLGKQQTTSTPKGGKDEL